MNPIGKLSEDGKNPIGKHQQDERNPENNGSNDRFLCADDGSRILGDALSSIILEIMVSVQVTTPFHYTAFKISPTHRLLSEFSFVLSLIEQASLIIFAL